MTIRTATIDDAYAIAEVHVLSWKTAYRGIVPESILDNLSVENRSASWAEVLDRGEPQVLVAERENRIVGFSSFGRDRDDPRSPAAYEIWSIYLEPDWWSQGIGRQLLEASLIELILHEARTISLWVLVDNHRAIRFYESAGFAAQPDSIRSLNFDGVPINEIRYLQRIS